MRYPSLFSYGFTDELVKLVPVKRMSVMCVKLD